MVNHVDAEVTKSHLEKGDAVVLNVLSEDSFREKHIPGTLNAPEEGGAFEAKVRSLAPDKDRTIIVHCSSNDCQASTRAARKLEAMGYRDVHDFKAGLQGWEEAGHAFENGQGHGEARDEKVSKGTEEVGAATSISEGPGAARPGRPAPGKEREQRERSEPDMPA